MLRTEDLLPEGCAIPETPLSDAEIAAVLERARLVRVAFAAEVPYVITFGCTYLDGSLVGTTSPGRKTELAARDSRVGFQLDTSLEDGLYEWESVRGEGRISFSTPEGDVLTALRAAFPEPPEWFVAERMANLADGRARTFRIQPEILTGRRSHG
jgi:nitroimidazol reductase NimA-like FMN-containing flavoprotein (pyridoxamine 5'-phosphate oxidase superfamily)